MSSTHMSCRTDSQAYINQNSLEYKTTPFPPESVSLNFEAENETAEQTQTLPPSTSLRSSEEISSTEELAENIAQAVTNAVANLRSGMERTCQLVNQKLDRIKPEMDSVAIAALLIQCRFEWKQGKSSFGEAIEEWNIVTKKHEAVVARLKAQIEAQKKAETVFPELKERIESLFREITSTNCDEKAIAQACLDISSDMSEIYEPMLSYQERLEAKKGCPVDKPLDADRINETVHEHARALHLGGKHAQASALEKHTTKRDKISQHDGDYIASWIAAEGQLKKIQNWVLDRSSSSDGIKQILMAGAASVDQDFDYEAEGLFQAILGALQENIDIAIKSRKILQEDLDKHTKLQPHASNKMQRAVLKYDHAAARACALKLQKPKIDKLFDSFKKKLPPLLEWLEPIVMAQRQYYRDSFADLLGKAAKEWHTYVSTFNERLASIQTPHSRLSPFDDEFKPVKKISFMEVMDDYKQRKAASLEH